MPWKLFVVKLIDKAEVSLRRYASSEDGKKNCSGPYGYHNASVVIGEVPFNEIWFGRGDDSHPHDDHRWPLRCAYCGYEFKPEDHWQHNLERIAEGMRGHELVRATLRDLPPGAMWSVDAGTELADICRGKPLLDAKHWYMQLPGGHQWEISAPSNDGGLWTIEGTVPEISMSPSILITGDYHGWVGVNGTPRGYLSDDLDGRHFNVNGERV